MICRKSIFTFALFILFVVALAFGAPRPAAAATSGSFAEIERALELLQANVERLRTSTSSTDRSTRRTTRATTTRTVNQSCMQEAVNTRESAIMAAFEKSNTALLSAMDKRKTAFTAVWSGTDISAVRSRYTAIWAEWKRDFEAIRSTQRSERQTAWRAFRETATKTCRATLPREESASQESSGTS